MPGVNRDNVGNVFTYHPPENDEQRAAYNEIRLAGLHLASTILASTTTCGDQQAAIRKVREAVMTANAAVALKGLV